MELPTPNYDIADTIDYIVSKLRISLASYKAKPVEGITQSYCEQQRILSRISLLLFAYSKTKEFSDVDLTGSIEDSLLQTIKVLRNVMHSNCSDMTSKNNVLRNIINRARDNKGNPGTIRKYGISYERIEYKNKLWCCASFLRMLSLCVMYGCDVPHLARLVDVVRCSQHLLDVDFKTLCLNYATFEVERDNRGNIKPIMQRLISDISRQYGGVKGGMDNFLPNAKYFRRPQIMQRFIENMTFAQDMYSTFVVGGNIIMDGVAQNIVSSNDTFLDVSILKERIDNTNDEQESRELQRECDRICEVNEYLKTPFALVNDIVSSNEKARMNIPGKKGTPYSENTTHFYNVPRNFRGASLFYRFSCNKMFFEMVNDYESDCEDVLCAAIGFEFLNNNYDGMYAFGTASTLATYDLCDDGQLLVDNTLKTATTESDRLNFVIVCRKGVDFTDDEHVPISDDDCICDDKGQVKAESVFTAFLCNCDLVMSVGFPGSLNIQEVLFFVALQPHIDTTNLQQMDDSTRQEMHNFNKVVFNFVVNATHTQEHIRQFDSNNEYIVDDMNCIISIPIDALRLHTVDDRSEYTRLNTNSNPLPRISSIFPHSENGRPNKGYTQSISAIQKNFNKVLEDMQPDACECDDLDDDDDLENEEEGVAENIDTMNIHTQQDAHQMQQQNTIRMDDGTHIVVEDAHNVGRQRRFLESNDEDDDLDFFL